MCLCVFSSVFSMFYYCLVNTNIWFFDNQVGTVMESASDFFTGRLTKKERKATIADELLSDRTLAQYR